jgi:hypothetical protein
MPTRTRASWRDVTDRFLLSSAELDELRRDAEAVGREAWNNATRTGHNVGARTQKELQHLGARVMDAQQRAPQSGGHVVPTPRKAGPQPSRPAPARTNAAPSPGAGAWRRIIDPIQAGVEAATDAATLGLGDPYDAARYATYGVGEGENWVERYKSLRQMQVAEDEYGRKHHPIARAVGGTVGTVGSIAMTGGVGAPVRAAPYVSRAVGGGVRAAIAHVGPHAAVAGAGAVASTAGQLASDLISGQPLDPGTYKDAAIGGAAGATATRYSGPRAGAIVEAYTTEGSRGLRKGDFSLERAQQNAVLGAHAGRIGDHAAQSWAQGLSNQAKGKLGERMSDVKTLASGQLPIDWQVPYPTSIGETYVDSITDTGLLIESKFGRSDLTKNQRDAAKRYENYRVDRWNKGHVGKAAGGLSGLLFGQSVENGHTDE